MISTTNETTTAPTQPERKKVIFSAIQPSDTITLGNYLGALKNWIALQVWISMHFRTGRSACYYHVRQEPAKFRRDTLEAYALLLACGVDLKKSIFFIQSHVHTHAANLVLHSATATPNSANFPESPNLRTNPPNMPTILMWGLICLPQSDGCSYSALPGRSGASRRGSEAAFCSCPGILPLGLTMRRIVPPLPSRTLTFPKTGARIMSLQDPTKKMSKSDGKHQRLDCFIG